MVRARFGVEGGRAVPDNASTHGCDWPATVRVKVPEACRSGYYSVTLRGEDAGGGVATGEIFFVVRPARPGRDSSILLQLTMNTDYAYNTWGGTSLYRGPDGPGRQVSFERPYSGFAGHDGNLLFGMAMGSEAALDAGAISDEFRGEFRRQVAESGHRRIELSDTGTVAVERPGERWQILDVLGAGPASYTVRRRGDELAVYDGTAGWESCWRNWEEPFVRWAEGAGYRMDYAVNADLEFYPEMLEDYRRLPLQRCPAGCPPGSIWSVSGLPFLAPLCLRAFRYSPYSNHRSFLRPLSMR